MYEGERKEKRKERKQVLPLRKMRTEDEESKKGVRVPVDSAKVSEKVIEYLFYRDKRVQEVYFMVTIQVVKFVFDIFQKVGDLQSVRLWKEVVMSMKITSPN